MTLWACITLLLFLSFTLSPRYSTFFSCNETTLAVEPYKQANYRLCARKQTFVTS